MIILTLRTDNPKAEIGIYDGDKELVYDTWQAHRQLAETIHTRIQQALKEANLKLRDIRGFVVYEGPGSFTGLRIGMSVANALAYGLGVPIVAESGEDWVKYGIGLVCEGKGEKTAMPEYGGEVYTTRPRK